MDNDYALPYKSYGRAHLGRYEAKTPGGFQHNGSTPLIASCRAIAAAKFGETVDVPEELIKAAAPTNPEA